MKIKLTAVGNKDEAFIERGFSDGINIISSDENNKGKTILIQSMMYALGNEPAFPSSFDYKQYYHYIEFEVKDTIYHLCRYNNEFVLKTGPNLMLLDSVSELKRYWNKYIFHLPEIVKNQIPTIVDPLLFLQLFFIGQDKKDSSNIAHAGYYNKTDFYNMLYSIFDLGGEKLDDEEIEKIKEKISCLKVDRKILMRQHKILKSQDVSVSYLSSISDRITFSKKLSEMEALNDKIAGLRKSRNSAATKRANWERTLKELDSLNRSITHGELRCKDCNSTNIVFSSDSKKNAYVFDVTSVEMRNEIIASIKEKIGVYNEEIDKLSAQINAAQNDLRSIMDDEAISLEAIVAYKQDVFTASDAEGKIESIDSEIARLNDQLQITTNTSESKKQNQQTLITSLIEEMNRVYSIIDPNGNLHFDLFSKKDEIYSGSEATIFHLSRLYAFKKILDHNYPIVVDSFRAEDLSTQKENIILNLFKDLPNQVILTTTLKSEELGKYDNLLDIHHIDYKNHKPSKILSVTYLEEFFKIMSDMSIKMQ